MKKNKILIITIIITIFIGVGLYFYNNKSIDIEKVLKTKDYINLSDKVKDYIRNYYYETGTVLLTQSNKKKDTPYLNPAYVEYLDNEEDFTSGYVPNSLKEDITLKLSTRGVTNLPSKYDLRDVNGISYVTPYERQVGETCWDYSLTSVITSSLLKRGLENDASTLDLSERMIDYATTDPAQAIDISVNPYYGYNVSMNALNEAGNWERYASVLINGIFPINESDWNYDKEYLGKVKLEDVIDLSKSPYQVNEIINVTDNNASLGFDEEFNNSIKQHITSYGAVGVNVRTLGRNSVSVPVSETNPAIDPDNNKYSSLFYKDVSSNLSTDHAVTIIGWNDNFTYNICVQSDGLGTPNLDGNCSSGSLKEINGAWIIKDSTANNKYDYLAYETVGSDYTLITDISLKNWDNSYQSGYANNKEVTFTKGNTKEKLVSIKLYDSNKTNLQNLKIYVDSLDGNSSQLVTTFSAEYPGMYTIDIPGDIILSENQFKLKIQGFAGRYSVFTSNVDEDIEIIMDNGKIENSILYQSLLNNYQNIIILKGTSRNLNQNINYIVKNSNNVDVTNKFNISHNYSKGNYIYSLMRFNRDIELGEYTIYAYVNDELYDTFNVTIDYYMEVLEGSGTEDNPYLISNPVQLDMIRLDRYAAYKLKNDIDLTYDTQNENGLFYNNGLGWNPITYDDSILNFGNHKIYYSEGFGGILDGNNKKIIGLYINRPNEDVVGLFRNTRGDNWQKTAIIKNIILENVNITGKNYVGSLIGYAFGVSYGYASSLVVENISTNGIVKGNNHIGGIIGYYLDGLETSKSPNMLTDNRHRLINLYNSASVEATNYAGGIVGLIGPFHNYNNIILQVYNWQNTGNITSEGVTGGLIGQAISRNERILSINNSINTGKVTGTNVAGIVYDFESEPDNNSFQNGSLILNNIYYVNDIGYDNTNEAITANNVEKHTITELTNDNLYESFTNFSTYYNKETINSIKRIPFLKIANPTYTSVSNIELDNETPVNLFDYVTGSNDITFSINDSSIAEIDSNGIITPLKNGSTTINIISNYDGYTNNISLIVDKLVIGDVNGDWHIGPADHMALARYLDGSLELTETQLLASDVNQDGNVNEVDRIILLGYLANSEEYTTIPYLGDVSFNITYVMNGGTNYENAPTSYIYGTGVIINGTPTREGYTFEGWCTTEELTTCAKTQTISTEDYGDKTYYAKWIDSTITTGDIDFDGNIDLKDSMLLLKYLEGTVELSEEQLLAADVNLDGQVNEVDKVILLKHLANVEEYATLPYLGEVSFSITYVMNGGTNYENAPTSYVYGTGTVINIIPTKEDSTFGGWCNDEELTTCAKTQTISQSDMGDKTYYAKWAEIIIDPGHDNPPEETEYSINYVLNGGINNDNAPTSYIYGTGTVMNIIPTKEGSTFGGWCTDEELANCSMTIEITPIDTGDKTYYAKWIENTTEIVQGDMNSDGVISLQDIISLLRLYLEMDEVTDELILIGDMNNDGTIGLQDIISLLKIYLGVQ